MKLKGFAELLAFSAAVSCIAAPGFAHAERCRHVGGGIPADDAGALRRLAAFHSSGIPALRRPAK
jgi:hypothetical protein